MERTPLLPTNDFIFKKIFGGNLSILQDFLKAVLDLPPEEYKELEVLDPNLDREFIEDKLGVLDVKVTTSTGQTVNIEVQVKPQRSIYASSAQGQWRNLCPYRKQTRLSTRPGASSNT